MNKTRKSRWIGVMLGALLSCGPVRSKNPLSDPAKAKADPRLEGSWARVVDNEDKEPMFLHVFSKTGAAMDLVLVGVDGQKGAGVVVFDAFPSVIAGKSYLNLRVKELRGDFGEHVRVLPLYLFARYEVAQDGVLTLWVLDDNDELKALVKAGKLRGSVKGETVLTESSSRLADFVARVDPSTHFHKFGSFRKLAGVQ